MAIDFEQARLGAGFGEEHVAISSGLNGVDFRLRAFEFEDDFAVARDLDGRSAGIVVGFGEREQDVAVREHPAIARAAGIAPGHFARAVEDVGLGSGSEE